MNFQPQPVPRRVRVSLSSNGVDAGPSFQQDPVRPIVSDWIMPGLDGLQLCREIRERENAPYTYFILLTSQDTRLQNYDLAMEACVDDFLTKPLDRLTIRMRLQVAERILRFTSEVRQLRKLIPICAWCRKIRNDDNYWQLVESYVTEQTRSEFSQWRRFPPSQKPPLWPA